jgi:hypothetical protein
VAYHTALALAAGRPFPVVIGERTVIARPVSVEVMLRVNAASAAGSPSAMAEAEYQLLRAAFPRPRFGWRDPVRTIARLPIEIRVAIVQRLMRPPVVEAKDSDDPLAALAAKQRAAVHGHRHANEPRPTLLLAAQACRAQFGESWYYNPDRWCVLRTPDGDLPGTVDGYVPHDVCWAQFIGLSALEAREQLLQARSARIASSGNEYASLTRQLLVAAYPPDPLTMPPRGGLVH